MNFGQTPGLGRRATRERRRIRARRGGAVLEMALVAPIMVMLAFGTVEYGYFVYVKNEVFSAASNGAQEASLSTSTNTTVQSAVDQVMQNAGLRNSGYSTVTSPSDVTTASTGATVTVTVSLSWGNVGIMPLPTAMGGIPGTKQISATATMRKQ